LEHHRHDGRRDLLEREAVTDGFHRRGRAEIVHIDVIAEPERL
jgi:hypothetical protein